ncbi:hypothetical protein M747DRAFT_167315 [Aspergillus niger ATCC 13496]|uniref:Uncharacterized protein n=1 Tax=Aspergillus niger ATCC 13496 TaxID=1353008 RepID=A0A370C6A9_ASPNG|nr:hypothetical protein M747DRAFT_167315 [Aspergillus niger ATCC 13496]
MLLLQLLGRLSDLCLHTCILHTWLRVGWFSSLFVYFTPFRRAGYGNNFTGTMDNHQLTTLYYLSIVVGKVSP